MDQIEIFEDDGDPRNARARIVRHPGVLRPGQYPAPARQYPVAYPQPAYQPAPMYQPQVYPTYQAPVIVRSRSRIADLPTGEVLALAAQAFAALQSLPAAPAPVGSTETDVSNLITYQSALAQHAKRDEQLRTVGALLSKLLA
ncbi:MAG: hypothetical protein HS111_34730 [Kofleriaceae bacterium]|jgi:hypothetical protein|nr:hypothetical protein [Kofleriaceae bacterium]